MSQYTLKNEPKGKGRNRNLVKILKEQIAVAKETIGVKSTYRPFIRPKGVIKMSCKGICERHKSDKPRQKGRYASGKKRRQVCEIFMYFIGDSCPCCGYRLRIKLSPDLNLRCNVKF